MPSAARPIADLPPGTCWIRWVDRIAAASTADATPQLTIFCTPLKEPGWESLQLDDARKVSTWQACRVSAGLLPQLAIGDVYRAGLRIGSLVMEEKTFSFAIPGDSRGSLETSVLCPVVKPRWWTAAWNVLPQSVYSIDHTLSASCLLLDDRAGSGNVVIPASETIRAFMAPHSAIALALVSGPWAQTSKTLVDPLLTGIAADGAWELGLSERLPDGWLAPLIANLLEPFSPAGAAAASSVYAGILASGCLSAVLPFNNCRLEFSARGFRFHDGRWFAAQITSMKWIGDAPVKVIRSAPASGDGQDGHFPVDRTVHPIDPDDYAVPVAVSSLDAPDAGSEAVDAVAPGMMWDGLPEVSRVLVPQPAASGRTPAEGSERVAQSAAVGTPSGHNGVAEVRFARPPAGPACSRFDQVVSLLQALVAGEFIDGFHCLPDTARPGMRGSHPVWQMQMAATLNGNPRTSDWAAMGPGSHWPRSLLVCEVTLGAGKVYWIEIEIEIEAKPKSTEACRALLLALDPDGPELSKVVAAAIGIARKRRGVWGSVPALVKALGVAAAATWIHTRTPSELDAAGQPLPGTEDGILSRASARRALESLLSPLEKENDHAAD